MCHNLFLQGLSDLYQQFDFSEEPNLTGKFIESISCQR